MRPVSPFAALPLLLVLCACGQSSVAGKYACSGIPGLNTLTLASDGTASQEGDILGHPTVGTGTYKEGGSKVTVTIAHQTLDGSQNGVPPGPQEMVFDVQSNGDLKWILATCHKG
jgi:hypothetical protein